MKKQKIAMALAAAIMVSAAGCGGTDGQAKGEEGSNGPVEIEFWYGLGGSMGETMEKTIASFNESQNEVIVKGVVQSSYDETDKMLQAAIASGEVPACYLASHFTATNFAKKGVVQYLDDYIAADPEFDKDDIIPAFLDYCRDEEGKVYSLPTWGTTQVIYYRKDMFEEANLDPDEVFATWQNVADAARTLQEVYKDVPDFYGFEPMSGMDCLVDMAYSNGGSIVSEDEKTVTFNSDEFVEALESARQWINEEKIMGIHFGGDGWEYWYKTIDDVMQGRAGGYVGSSGDQGDLDFNIIAAHVQPGFNDNPAKPYVDPIAAAIVKKAPDVEKEAAFKWLTYLNKVGTKNFSMQTGYVPVRSSVAEDPEYKEFLEKNPQALIPLKQAEIGRKKWIDPTGKVEQALADACDLIEIENVPAKEALDEAAAIAQQALDEYWANQE
ncbi:MAG: ABC transporter substrate-binding protein [Clostridiales bacterium]|nr:ABC transporter substrate-binding protein [Clostridiales bacterium]